MNPKDTRASLAQQTLQIIEAGHYTAPSGRRIELRESIAASVVGTKLFREETPAAKPTLREWPTRITVTAETTCEAIARLAAENGRSLCALNFASARNPGGGFLGGAQAQEEALARSSTLYPTLLAQPEYYERNRANRSTLYLDLAIYSPLVAFFRDDAGALLETPVFTAVITAPAPNAGAIHANEPARAAEIEPTLRRRAALVLAIAAHEGVERLILGAWGCGVFRNDPKMVARVFAELLTARGAFAATFEELVFAIYDRTETQAVMNAFRAELGENAR